MMRWLVVIALVFCGYMYWQNNSNIKENNKNETYASSQTVYTPAKSSASPEPYIPRPASVTLNPSAEKKMPSPSPSNVVSNSREVSNFTCDGRQHCSQMRSKEEAYYFIKHCPNTKMDGDGDGIPCEQQFP